MSSYFEPKKDALKSDEFVSVMDHVTRWVLQYQIPIIIFVAIGFISIVAALVIKNNKEQNLQNHYALIYKASQDKDVVKSLEALASELGDSKAKYVLNIKLAAQKSAANKLDEAMALLDSVKSVAPEPISKIINLTMGQLAWQLDKKDEAIKILDLLTQDSLVGMQAKYIKAIFLKESGKIDEAKALLAEVIAGKDVDAKAAKMAEGSLNVLYLAEIK